MRHMNTVILQPEATMHQQRLFTVEQLAERWHLHPETIRRYIRTRQLRAGYRGLSNSYLISSDEVVRFERERMGLVDF